MLAFRNVILFIEAVRTPFLKSIGWISWNSLFGLGVLVPLFVFTSMINPDAAKQYNVSLEQILEKIASEGILIFFCNAIMAACLIDYIISKIDFGKMFLSLMFITLLMSFLLTCLIFGTSYLLKSDFLKREFLEDFQIGLAVFTVIYCSFFKVLLFYYE